MLATAAGLIGNKRSILLKPGWTEPCIIWTLVVAESGTMKSPGFLAAVNPVHRLQLQMEFTHKKETAAWEAGGSNGDARTLRRVIIDDSTIEALRPILEENPGGLLLAKDELRGWFGSFTRYKGGSQASHVPDWLSIHRAATIIQDRRTGDKRHLFVPRAAVSITGSIQPAILAKAMTPEFLDSGLGARIPMGMPPRRLKQWTELHVRPDTERRYVEMLNKLLYLSFADTSPDDADRAIPHTLDLSPGAKAVWVEFFNDFAMMQWEADGEIASAYAKLEAYAARLALLHHVVEHVSARQ